MDEIVGVTVEHGEGNSLVAFTPDSLHQPFGGDEGRFGIGGWQLEGHTTHAAGERDAGLADGAPEACDQIFGAAAAGAIHQQGELVIGGACDQVGAPDRGLQRLGDRRQGLGLGGLAAPAFGSLRIA